MAQKQPKYRKIYKTVCLLVLLALAVYLATLPDTGLFLRGRGQSAVVYSSDDQVTGSNGLVNADFISAKRFQGSVLLVKNLPAMLGHNDALCFTSYNALVTVWIDGTAVYRFNPTENLTGRGYGTAHHIISLAPADAGKEVQIVAVSIYYNHGSGRILNIRICPPTTNVRLLVREQLVPFSLSVLITFFGAVIIALHCGLVRKNILPYNLLALGTSMLLLGTWCLVDTGLPQLFTGCIIACRVLDYSLLHLVAYPLVCFVSSLTRQKRPFFIHLSFGVSATCILLMLSLRLLGGMDMHNMISMIYFSYFSPILIIAAMLLDNRRYCRKNGVPANLRHFYVGVSVLSVCGIADIVFYLLGWGSRIGHGMFLRFGLCFYVVELLFQLLHWWSRERTSIERDRFVNRVLQYAMSDEDPEKSIQAAMQYLGTELLADRAYIFEDQHDGTFDNTYEWCREGVSAEIDNLKGLPFEGVIDVWYNEYKRSYHILIYDIEAYRAISENMYNVLKPQGIRTLVTGPLEVNGEYIGFFGVDNPPVEAMQEVSEIIRLLSYFLSQLILRRDGQNRLIRYSYYDSMTGAKNRRAFNEAEKAGFTPGVSYGFIMCDINGLKRANDTLGHDAGDAMIVDVASCLAEVFDIKNVYRIGGDEFAILVPQESESELADNANRAKTLIAEKGRSASFGAVFNAHAAMAFDVVKAEADTRMYADKDRYYQGRNDRRKH